MRGGASLPRMMVERISTFEPGRSVGGFHQTLELGSIHVATFDEARRHFVDLALVLRQSFRARSCPSSRNTSACISGRSMSRAATCKWSAPLAQPGNGCLKRIFRYITREGGRLAARVQKASVWSSAAQRPVDFRRSDDNSLPGGGTPTKATGSPVRTCVSQGA
jgi:hypothetical protein